MYSVEEKFSTDSDKVVMHMLTKAHISDTHTLSLSVRCSAVRGCVVQLSQNRVRIFWDVIVGVP